MLITPALVALHLIALCVSGALLLASGFAWTLLRHWDIASGSELQILGASLLIGIAVGSCALHLLALGEKPTAPRRYAALRAALIAFMLAAIILGIRWTVQRG